MKALHWRFGCPLRIRATFNTAIVLLVTAPLWPAAAQAPQPYPARAVTIIVPFPPGGGTDIGARIVAQKLADLWGRPVVIENRGGAAGNIGLGVAAMAAPDGYTLLTGNIGTQSINPSLYKNLSYNPDTAFQPISLIAELPLVLTAHPGFAPGTIGDVVALAKKSPGKLTYGSSGVGGAPQLAMAMLEDAARLDLLHVPYKGGGPMMQDVVGGHINLAFATVLEVIGNIQGGAVKAIAVSSAQRVPSLPNVPTIAESGLAGFNSISWIGFLAPAATPAAIVEKVAADTRKVVGLAEVRDRLAGQGAVPIGSTTAEFAALIANDRARYARIIADRGIKAE